MWANTNRIKFITHELSAYLTWAKQVSGAAFKLTGVQCALYGSCLFHSLLKGERVMGKTGMKAMASVFAAATLVTAPAAFAACSIYFSSTGTYSIAQNSIAVPNSFSFSCSPGVITGSFTSLASQSNLTYRLERLTGGSWSTVATGAYISYSGTAGTYRYVVQNTGGAGNYSFRYSHP